MTPPIISIENLPWFSDPLDEREKGIVGEYCSWQGPSARKVALAGDRTISGFGIIPFNGKWRLVEDSLFVRLDNGEVLFSKMSPSGNFFGGIPLRRFGLPVLPRRTAEVVRTSMMPRARYRSVAFYMDNAHHVAAAQKRVFDKFGYEIDQVKTGLVHGVAIDDYLVSHRGEFDYLLVFDTDTVILHPDAIPTLLANAYADDRLVGAAAQSNHLNTNHPFATAACLALSIRLWDRMGQPTMRGACHVEGVPNRADTAEELTWAAEEDGVTIALLWPSHSEEEKYRIGLDRWFGYGTTYASADGTPLVYHAGESRFGAGRFIRKCNEILSPPG